MKLILFYNSDCKFCNNRAKAIKRRDVGGTIILEDIADPTFIAESFDLELEDLQREIHVQYVTDGEEFVCTLKGFDAVIHTYYMTDYNRYYHLIRFMRLPVVYSILKFGWKIMEWLKIKLARFV